MADLKTLVEREIDRAGEPAFAFEDLEGIRVRRHRRKRITAAVVGLGLVLLVSLVGASIYRSTPDVPADPPDEPVDFGIFEPMADRIVYYRDGSLWCEQIPVRELAGQFGTPLYIYSRATLLEHYDRLLSAFRPADPLICYSVKSCQNLAVGASVRFVHAVFALRAPANARWNARACA